MNYATKTKLRRAVGGLIVVLLIIVSGFLLYASRHPDPTLFYFGAAVEVPQERAIAVMNPFRDKTSERTAERLIRDLKTSDCVKII